MTGAVCCLFTSRLVGSTLTVELMCCGVVVIVGNGTYRAFGIGITVCIC